MKRLLLLSALICAIFLPPAFADDEGGRREQKAREELSALRQKLKETQEALKRLSTTAQRNSAEIEEWGNAANKAAEDSWEQAQGMFVDLSLGILDSRAEKKLEEVNGAIRKDVDLLAGTIDPDRRREIHERLADLKRDRERFTEVKDVLAKGVGELNDVLDTYKWATGDAKDMEKGAEGAYRLVMKLIGDEKVQEVLKLGKPFGKSATKYASNAKSIIDSTYNVWTEIAAMKRIDQMDKNGSEFLDATKRLSERTRKLVARIKEKEREAADLAALVGSDEKATLPDPPAKWQLPKSPGGIALNPGLSISGDIGNASELTAEDGRVILVASKGRYVIESLNAQSFATIFRTVASGEIPYITIGSEPSSRNGSAKVTYSPSLINTREGLLLYEADKQFKAIFAHYPFGDDYRLNTVDDKLASGYPGPGGEFTRLWITSSGIRLKLEGGRLILERHGMRINAETTLQGTPQSDPEMEAYAERLTEHWDEIADDVWQFRAIEDLAVATALAFWARQNQIKIGATIWDLPPRSAETPEYAPVVGFMGKANGVTGGVALTPEEKATSNGRLFLYQLAVLIDGAEQEGRSVILNRILFGFIALLIVAITIAISALLLWMVVQGAHTSYREAVRIVAKTTVLQGIVALVAAPFAIGGIFSPFDRNFLALCATVAAAPIILFFVLKGAGAGWSPVGRKRAKIFSFLYSLMIPPQTGIVGMAVAILTVALFGVIPGRTMEGVLTAELAPIDVLSDALCSAVQNPRTGEISVYPVPLSLAAAFRKPYIQDNGRLQGERGENVRFSGEKSPFFPVESMTRVRWPDGMAVDSDITHYTEHGDPP